MHFRNHEVLLSGSFITSLSLSTGRINLGQGLGQGQANQQTHLLYNNLPGELPYRSFKSNWVTYFIKIKGGKRCVTAEQIRVHVQETAHANFPRLYCQYQVSNVKIYTLPLPTIVGLITPLYAALTDCFFTTRHSRIGKRDTSFRSVQKNSSDINAWESLI